MWPLNTGNCLIQVASKTGLTVIMWIVKATISFTAGPHILLRDHCKCRMYICTYRQQWSDEAVCLHYSYIWGGGVGGGGGGGGGGGVSYNFKG